MFTDFELASKLSLSGMVALESLEKIKRNVLDSIHEGTVSGDWGHLAEINRVVETLKTLER